MKKIILSFIFAVVTIVVVTGANVAFQVLITSCGTAHKYPAHISVETMINELDRWEAKDCGN